MASKGTPENLDYLDEKDFRNTDRYGPPFEDGCVWCLWGVTFADVCVGMGFCRCRP
jgi:hypothetical protein